MNNKLIQASHNSTSLIGRLVVYATFYCLITQESPFRALFISLFGIVLIYTLIRSLEYTNIGTTLGYLSALVLLPLALPQTIKDQILPFGYQYISISFIASLFHIGLNKQKLKGLSLGKLSIYTITAAFAPTSYFAGPSATFEEVNNSKISGFKFGSITKKTAFLASSGFFRITIGYLLASSDTILVNNIFSNIGFISLLGILLGLVYGIFNFWKYYLLFSGASELCQALLLLLGINVIDNFKNPERSVFYHEIWSGWHLNITQRVRDYLFTPITLFALRRFSNLNSFLRYILIEGMPAACLFLILAIWHGGSPHDFIFALVSTILTVSSRSISKNRRLLNLISQHFLIKELICLLSLSIFGLALGVYDLDFTNIKLHSQTLQNFWSLIPYLTVVILISIYYRYQRYIHQLRDSNNDIGYLKEHHFFFIEILCALYIQIFLLPSSDNLNGFLYFAN